MPTHPALHGHHRHEGPGPVTGISHRTSRSAWAVPVTGGVVLGLYTVFLADDNGASTPRAWMIGIIAGLVAMGAGYVLIKERAKMIAEVRAAAFGALFGISLGFLYSLTQVSVLRASLFGLFLGGALAVVSYYVFYMHEH
ncbi:hypothetical protein ACQEVX_14810 [Streptomyces syringium]|uniref:hypothetical protein n=1 Tax=Streptomyces syringium TaxID=76729 RepID=UPI003D929B48